MRKVCVDFLSRAEFHYTRMSMGKRVHSSIRCGNQRKCNTLRYMSFSGGVSIPGLDGFTATQKVPHAVHTPRERKLSHTGTCNLIIMSDQQLMAILTITVAGTWRLLLVDMVGREIRIRITVLLSPARAGDSRQNSTLCV